MGTVHTATGIWFVGINTFAAATENTVVLGSEPGEVTPDQLIGVGRVNELDPLAREIKGDFTDGELKKLLVNGNAESVYFNEDADDPCSEFNQSQSSRLRIDFEENAVQQIVLLGGPEGTWMSNESRAPDFEDANWVEAPKVPAPMTPRERR